MTKANVDLLQGTLDLLILRTVALEPMHGWGISQRIQQISQDVLRVQQGSLYPALHRLEQQGWRTGGLVCMDGVFSGNGQRITDRIRKLANYGTPAMAFLVADDHFVSEERDR